MRELNFLLELLKGRWKLILLAALVGSFTVASGVGLLTISTYLIAAAALHPPLYTLQLGITGVRFFGFTRGFFRYGERIISHNLSLKILSQLRTSVFASFYNSFPEGIRNPGRVFKRIVEDVENLEDFFVRSIYPLFVLIVVVFSSFLFFSFFNLKLSLLISALFIIASVIFFGGALVTGFRYNYGQFYENYEKMVNDVIGGVADIQLYGREKFLGEKVNSIAHQFEEELRKRNGAESFLDFSVNGYLFFTSLLVLFAGWSLWNWGFISGKSMLVITIGYIAIYEALFPLINAGLKFAENLGATRELIELGKEEGDGTNSGDYGPGPYSVEIRDLHFSYDGRKVFENLNLKITPGTKVAIVGASGSGKSTLVSLIAGVRRPERGEVLINGVPSYTSGERGRERICVLPQEPYIFFDTVERNISLGLSVPGEEIEEAIRLAELEEFVGKLPSGLGTVVGPEGYHLSGGEAERIAIARIFVRKCELLLLDEPFEHLDPLTGGKILDNLFGRFQGITIIIVTHHLSFLSKFDEIVVIKAGKVAEKGKLDELLARDGELKRLLSFTVGIFRE